MKTATKTATLIRENVEGFTGTAHLYRLSPPMTYTDWGEEGEETIEAEYVIVSAVVAMFAGPETYIFPAHEDGTIESWGELGGSYRGGMNHETALRNAGYTVEG